MIMTQKLYTEMSAEEQAAWVQDFAQVMEQHGERLALLAKGKETATADDAGVVRQVFGLLAAWPFAQDFCEKAQRYGDYMARTSRLPVYIEKVKERLADGLTMTDQDGNVVAYVNPSTPMRRRGRPTKEEVAARLRGETDNGQVADDVEARKRLTIAAMLGLQVVVHGDAPREKNNAELKAERDARRAEEAKMNPSLFGDDAVQHVAVAQQQTGQPDGGPVPSGSVAGVSPCAQLMSDAYELRMAQDKLNLNQLAPLCSTELAKRIATVQSLRVTAEAASERAKTLADIGQPATVIEPYSQQAKEATEAYLAIYAAVDEELAILHKRLYLDEPFKERFIKKHSTASQKVNIESILHVTRPYYEKVKMQEKKAVEEIRAKAKSKGENEEQAVTEWLAEHQSIDDRVKNIIEQENPEYAAKMKAEQEKKEELQQLHRYIMRTDKPASDERVKTMTERIERVRQLAGDEVANSYLPVLEKTKEENRKRNESRPTPSPSLSGRGVDSDAADEKKAKKAAVKKATKQDGKKATKQEDKKKGAKGNKGETPNSSEQPAAETMNP